MQEGHRQFEAALIYRARFMPAKASDGDTLKGKKSDGLDTYTQPHTLTHARTHARTVNRWMA